MNRTVEAILKLSAKLGNTAAFGQLAAKMAMVDKQAKAYNRTQGAIARTANAAYLATARLMAPAAIAYGAASAVKSYAALERQIGRIGITAEASAAETQAVMGGLQMAASQYAMPINDVIAGLETLVASGRNLQDAMAFLPSVLATAQASGSEVAAVAATADAMASSLGISADRMTASFDILAAAGKAGKFELRDMAAELPALAPAFAALGYRGEAGLMKLAAALQTVRAQTGSSSEAATNLMNVFQKMETNDTVKRFHEFGIDLRREMDKARADGRDLLKTFLILSEQALKGDYSKIPQLFGDQQVQKGMRALLTGAEGMERIEAALHEVDGTVLQDLNRVLSDTESKVQRLENAFKKLWNSAGAALADVGGADVMEGVADNLEYGSYMREGLKKRGMSYWERENWIFKNTFDPTARNLAAFEGGWRSKEGWLAAQGPMSASPELPSHSGYAGAAPPVPTPRPMPMTAEEQRRSYGKAISQMPKPTRDEVAARRAAVMDAGGWANEADKVTQALAAGGDQAAQKLASGGEEAGKAIGGSADELRAAGDYIAAAIRSAGAGVAAQVRAAGASAIRADVGRSGPQYEGRP